MVLAVLGLVWAVVIGSYVKDKVSFSTRDSVSAFHHQLSTLERTQPGGVRVKTGPAAPRPTSAQSNEARRRRRDVLFILMSLAAFTFVVAVFKRTMPFIALNVICDLAVVGFISLLVTQQRIVAEQTVKVRHIRPATVRTVGASYQPTGYQPIRMAAGGQRLR